MTDEPTPHWVVRFQLAPLPPGTAYTRDDNHIWLSTDLTREQQMRCIAEVLDALGFPAGLGYQEPRPDLRVILNGSSEGGAA